MSAEQVRHVSVSVDRPASEVYAFASKPENMPRWAQGLADSIERVNGEWVASSPMGKVTVRFSEPNPFGVLDHTVTLESGVSVLNHFRVLERDERRSEVVFTLFRRPGVSDSDYDSDAAAVEQDLRALKALLER